MKADMKSYRHTQLLEKSTFRSDQALWNHLIVDNMTPRVRSNMISGERVEFYDGLGPRNPNFAPHCKIA